MASAILYIRVSTDEQAMKGYSQRGQEERLVIYCKNRQISIISTVLEDHSAKTFNRPAWNGLMKSLRNKNARPNLILFTRWDRFSRNTGDAYYMISSLEKMGIEPMAIEQPIDKDIPGNKPLLAFYIVSGEVENDLRSLSIKQGMARAKSEGRYMGRAPIGYINVSNVNGTKSIEPREPEATLVRRVFRLLAEGNLSLKEIYRKSSIDGLKISVSAFYNMVENPIYYGLLRISSEEKSPPCGKIGTHIPLISRDLFVMVQKRLKSKAQSYTKHIHNMQLFLRGLFYCPLCGRKLTGSGSRGRNKKYFYYHCRPPCRFRLRTETLNSQFISLVTGLSPLTAYAKLFGTIASRVFGITAKEKMDTRAHIEKEINKLIERSAKGRELLIRGTIDEEDYLSIRADCEKRVNSLGLELNDAYRFEVNERQRRNSMLEYFGSPRMLFENSDTSLQRKSAALILKEMVSCSSLLDVSCLGYGPTAIYGLDRANGGIESSNTQITGNEQIAWVKEIIKIEKGLGNVETVRSASVILRWMVDFGQLCALEK